MVCFNVLFVFFWGGVYSDVCFDRVVFFFIPRFVSVNVLFELIFRDKFSSRCLSLSLSLSLFKFFFFTRVHFVCVCVCVGVRVHVPVYIFVFFFPPLQLFYPNIIYDN